MESAKELSEKLWFISIPSGLAAAVLTYNIVPFDGVILRVISAIAAFILAYGYAASIVINVLSNKVAKYIVLLAVSNILGPLTGPLEYVVIIVDVLFVLAAFSRFMERFKS